MIHKTFTFQNLYEILTFSVIVSQFNPGWVSGLRYITKYFITRALISGAFGKKIENKDSFDMKETMKIKQISHSKVFLVNKHIYFMIQTDFKKISESGIP